MVRIIRNENTVSYQQTVQNQQPAVPSSSLYPNLRAQPSIIITKKAHVCAKKVLELAGKVAQRVKHSVPNAPKTNHSTRSNYSRSQLVYAPSTHNFFSPTINHCRNSNNDRNNRDNQTVLRIILGIIGVVGLIWGAVKLAKLHAKDDNLEVKIGEFGEAVTLWKSFDDINDYKLKIDQIIILTRGILDRKKKNLSNSIYRVAIPILAGGGLLVAGALVGASLGSALIALGILSSLAGVVYGVYKSVRKVHTEHDLKVANEIIQNIKVAKDMAIYEERNEAFLALP